MKYQRLTASLLAFAMVFGVGTILPKQAGFQPSALTASAEETGTYGDLTYTKYDTYVEISKCDKNAETVEIPAEIDGLPVTTIGGYAFYKCTSLTSVTIPDSVTSIGNYAFYECTSLTSVTIPDSVTTIESSAFSGCTSLTSINVSKQNLNYTSIDGILYDKEGTTLICCPAGKTSVTIPDSVTTIGNWLFLTAPA